MINLRRLVYPLTYLMYKCIIFILLLTVGMSDFDCEVFIVACKASWELNLSTESNIIVKRYYTKSYTLQSAGLYKQHVSC